ncbi:low-density lipoprotein receptor-like [Watersipora subatra]|uniref:low-density lipoprotein receptor-like n=1 Tax=Watersipora subatra TaxID=2589382 RepID=UPI00355B377F
MKKEALISLHTAVIFCVSLYKLLLLKYTLVEHVLSVAAYSPGWSCNFQGSDLFRCGNGINCVPYDWLCNAIENCPDGSDEVVCHNTGVGGCASADQWIPDSYKCNGYTNCDDLSDEKGCTCPEFTCASGMCIRHIKKCDGINDCGDWSDEPSNCDCPTIKFTCESGYNNFAKKCIAAELVCDGVTHCPDGSDEFESRCSVVCSAGQQRCTIGVSNFDFSPCIDAAYFCDDYSHCADHSDEAACQGVVVSCKSSGDCSSICRNRKVVRAADS